MGFFSWITNDTKLSIANMHSSQYEGRTVYMHDDKGNVWTEHGYDGYGVFGGKDFYVLLAEMNNVPNYFGDEDDLRRQGLHLAFGIRAIQSVHNPKDIFMADGIDFFNYQDTKLIDDMSANDLIKLGEYVNVVIKRPGIKWPNLVHAENWKWVNEQPKDCPYQGYFY